MVRLGREAAADPLFSRSARCIIGHGDPAELRAWIAERWRYVPDPPGEELVEDPRLALQSIALEGSAAGDCDDAAVFAAALAIAGGWPARYVAVGWGGLGLSHVWAEAAAPGGSWRELDATRPAGAELEPPTSRVEVPA